MSFFDTYIYCLKTQNYNILNPTITSIIKNIILALGIFTEEIPSVEILSSDYSTKEPGSWHIEKNASWIDSNKAEVILDINSEMKKRKQYKKERCSFFVYNILSTIPYSNASLASIYLSLLVSLHIFL